MLVCCSCGSSKYLYKQKLAVEFDGQAYREDTTLLNEKIKRIESGNATEKIEEVSTVYDTSKLADLSIDKHPIFSETKKSTKSGTDMRKEEISNATIN